LIASSVSVVGAGSVRRVATPAPAHRRPVAVAARVRAGIAIVVMLGVAIVACVRLAAPSRSAPPTLSAPPAAASSSAVASAVSPSVAPSPSPSPVPPRYVFPVQSADASYARTHEEYPASDILAACGTPVVAATDGVVLEVNRVDRWSPTTDDGAWRGGRFLAILGDDGVRYYGGHFSLINDELAPGTRVAAGQPVGKVGTTGKSSACHLHFGISPPCGRAGDWWTRRGVIWPWRYLDAWRAGTSTSAVPEITDWQAAHGCPTAPDPALP
jgi:murein DD-endopeptidase MepM/ murein hydrolase activator NlpD